MSRYFFLLLSLPFLLEARGEIDVPLSVEELRLEVADLKYALKVAQVEWTLLEERIKKQETPTAKPPSTDTSSRFANIEKKISQLETLTERLSADLRSLNTNISLQLTKLQDYDKRLEEVGKLQGTLSSLSKMISHSPSDEIHKVQSGDSLEKIARIHHTSVEHLKRLNHLKDDKIRIGQELKVRDAS